MHAASAFSDLVQQFSAQLVVEHEALRAEKDALALEVANLQARLRTQEDTAVNGDNWVQASGLEGIPLGEPGPGKAAEDELVIQSPEAVTSSLQAESDFAAYDSVDRASMVRWSQSVDLGVQPTRSVSSSGLSAASQRAIRTLSRVTTESSLGSADSKAVNRNSRDLQHMFMQICGGRGKKVEGLGSGKWRTLCLTASEIADMSRSHRDLVMRRSPSDWGLKRKVARIRPMLSRSGSELCARYAEVIVLLNEAMKRERSTEEAEDEDVGWQPRFSWKLSKPSPSNSALNFDGFQVVMTMTEADLQFFNLLAYKAEIDEIRETLIKAGTVSLIAEATQISQHDLLPADEGQGYFHNSEGLVTFVIILNALSLGVSLDVKPAWKGWKYLEWFFTMFFLSEMVAKIVQSSRNRGCRRGLFFHFLGPDKLWNTFDGMIVLCAIVDSIVTLVVEDSDLGNLTIVRLARLARLSRLLRLLRLRIFKTLLLLISGAVNGLRILLFAMILLAFVIYCCALLIRYFLWSSLEKLNCSAITCSSDEEVLWHERKMFRSMPHSMFTVFRCVIGDCQSSKGESMVEALNTVYGWTFVVPYVLGILFFQFGLFNLIAAIFVESTMEYAKFDATRRRELQHAEHIRSARTLQALVLKFVVEADASEGDGSLSSKLSTLFAVAEGDGDSEGVQHVPSQSVKVTPEVFSRVLADNQVKKLMDDLDVSLAGRRKLFEALDADGNGTLSVQELIDGIMRLRGPADKTDIVGMSLVVRSMQHTLKKIEASWRQERKRKKMTLTRAGSTWGDDVSPRPPVFEGPIAGFATPGDSEVSYALRNSGSSSAILLDDAPSAYNPELKMHL